MKTVMKDDLHNFQWTGQPSLGNFGGFFLSQNLADPDSVRFSFVVPIESGSDKPVIIF